jgi:hypothetical protein
MGYYDTLSEILGRKLSKQQPLVNDLEILPYDPLEVAPPFKTTQWKDLEVHYDDETHLYFVVKEGKRVPLISVTTFIDLFVPEFDFHGQAMRCARKPDYDCACLDKSGWDHMSYDIRAEMIKKAWKENNKQATNYGTAAHAGCEYLAKQPQLKDKDIMKLLRLGAWGMDAVRPVIAEFLPKVRKLLSPYRTLGYEFIAEPVLTDPTIGMAGQSDLVLVNHNTKKITVLDYKTNKRNPKFDKGFTKMEGLFNQYDNNPWSHYSIQLSTYCLMLKQLYPGYEIENASLVWLEAETGEIELLPIDFLAWMPLMEAVFENMKSHEVFKNAYSIIGKN